MKVVFFDVDGTLISHKIGKIPDSTINAIKQIRNKGIFCVVCSGRHIEELKELEFPLSLFDAYILLNGQLILDNNFKEVWSNPIEGNNLKNLIHLYENNIIPIQLLEKNTFYINYVNDYVRFAQESIHTSVPRISEYTQNVIYQGIAFVNEQEEKELKEKLSDCLITRWNPYAVDIVSNNGGKGKAIQQFLDIYQIPVDQSFAFGDGENDMDMFDKVGFSIAMGNAVPLLKSKANYVTSDIDEDGIYNGLSFLNFID
ncbi:MAG: Cof-type HAD-IIB family hydrolase [Erysipelotrichaceae bacterium]|uniref:Cof-type HAD-IIB family hydrolase n=1 Tax=Floccifex sp. TaxID=2815810 RepID=UPI002A757350|nr:Cof-type HAD-IIB family hydrolase [Floccifex sp.]MDD7282157.1 Cof-type HAD-IIB family hydrolase [Erysipelotrichaceae bacterium]MDY2959050.1 Cof-type HAD-IIB family hydrolase [Floccifex sp.]